MSQGDLFSLQKGIKDNKFMMSFFSEYFLEKAIEIVENLTASVSKGLKMVHEGCFQMFLFLLFVLVSVFLFHLKKITLRTTKNKNYSFKCFFFVCHWNEHSVSIVEMKVFYFSLHMGIFFFYSVKVGTHSLLEALMLS